MRACQANLLPSLNCEMSLERFDFAWTNVARVDREPNKLEMAVLNQIVGPAVRTTVKI